MALPPTPRLRVEEEDGSPTGQPSTLKFAGCTVSFTGSVATVTPAGGAGIGGSTGAADNRLLRSDGAGGATLQASGITVSDSDQLSGTLQLPRGGAGGVTLAAADSGKLITIGVGGGADSVTLPAAPTAGTWYDFAVIGAGDDLTVQAQGSHVIRVGAAASSAGGTLTSSVVGSLLHLVYAANNLWIGVISGTWVAA